MFVDFDLWPSKIFRIQIRHKIMSAKTENIADIPIILLTQNVHHYPTSIFIVGELSFPNLVMIRHIGVIIKD